MGKSRMIDELSTKHLVITVNLRPEKDRGAVFILVYVPWGEHVLFLIRLSPGRP
jgi:hypothetical protein